LVDAAAWQEGTMIRGKYRILGKVGEGGMAVVYKAMHTSFQELRALKVMNPALALDNAFVKRFTHEAVLTRKLLHPNAVRVDDIDEADDGRPFIVMEYIEGRNLEEVIRHEAPMPWDRVCQIARQVASALDYAHRMNIVHRDIKPSNIVLVHETSPQDPSRTKETAKVLDFGIAKALEAGSDKTTQTFATLTGTGGVIGTPAYMSPEQARGLRGDQLDGRSDLYSLGIVMYQMLVGRLPFKADTGYEWILAHVQTPPTPTWVARPDLAIPSSVATVVMQCLEKDPRARPDDAAALIEGISQAEQAAPDALSADRARARISKKNSLPASYSPPSELPKTRTWVGWLLALVAIVALAGAAIVWKMRRPEAATSIGTPQQTQLAQPAAQTTPPAPKTEGAAPSDAPSQASPEPAPVIQSPVNSGPAASIDSAAAAPSDNTPGKELTSAPAALTRQPQTSSPKAIASPSKPDTRARDRAVAAAIIRAKEDEREGRYEDALKEYEQAASLDPANSSLKRNVQRLRTLLAEENEIIK